MKDGWGIVSDKLGKAKTAHFFTNDGKETVCGMYDKKKQSYLNISAVRISKHRKCKQCKKFLDSQIKLGGKRDDVVEKNIEREVENYLKRTTPQIEVPRKTLFFMQAECSEPNCKVKGIVAFSSPETFSTVPHYCSDHNPRVQDTIKKMEAVA